MDNEARRSPIYHANAIVLALRTTDTVESAAERMADYALSDEVTRMAADAVEDADVDVREDLQEAITRAKEIAWERTQTPACGQRLTDREETLKTAIERCADWTPSEWRAVRVAIKTATRAAEARVPTGGIVSRGHDPRVRVARVS